MTTATETMTDVDTSKTQTDGHTSKKDESKVKRLDVHVLRAGSAWWVKLWKKGKLIKTYRTQKEATSFGRLLAAQAVVQLKDQKGYPQDDMQLLVEKKDGSIRLVRTFYYDKEKKKLKKKK